MASVLHGLNDWDTLNAHWGWVAVVVVSGLLFLTYAKAGPVAAVSREAGQDPAPAPVLARDPAPAATATFDIEAELAALKRQLPGGPGQ